MDLFLQSVERRAFRMAQISTGSREDALDAVQDAMCALVKNYGAKPESQWRTLFYQILRNRLKDWRRRSRVRAIFRTWLGSVRDDSGPEEGDPLEQVPDTAPNNPGDQVLLRESVQALDKAIGKLPERQQQAFLLRAWEELSVRDTASVMGCSEGSVKTHYSRALAALREDLKEFAP